MNFKALLGKVLGVGFVYSLILLLFSLVIPKVMSQADFSTYIFSQGIVVLLMNFMPFGTGMAVVVMLYQKSEKEYSDILSYSIYVVIPTTFFFVFLSFILADYFFEFSNSYLNYTLIVLSALMSINLTYINYLRSSQMMLPYAIAFIVYGLFLTFPGIAAYLLFNNVISLFLSLVVFQFIYALLSCFMLFRLCDVKPVRNIKYSILVSSFKYGLPIVLSSIVLSFLVTGDKIIYANLSVANDYAKYAIAITVSSTTMFMVNNFASAWGGFLSKNLACKSESKVLSDFECWEKKTAIFFIFFILFCFFQIILYKFMYEIEYPGMEGVIVILTFTYTLLGISKFYTGFVNYYGRNELVLLCGFLGVVVILLLSLTQTLSPRFMALCVLFGMLVNVTAMRFVCSNLLKVRCKNVGA
jgi:O-antigen/teichoic acid export membrane protein